MSQIARTARVRSDEIASRKPKLTVGSQDKYMPEPEDHSRRNRTAAAVSEPQMPARRKRVPKHPRRCFLNPEAGLTIPAAGKNRAASVNLSCPPRRQHSGYRKSVTKPAPAARMTAGQPTRTSRRSPRAKRPTRTAKPLREVRTAWTCPGEVHSIGVYARRRTSVTG